MGAQWSAIALLTLVAGAHGAVAQNYSTWAVNVYSTCNLHPDLSNRVEAADRFRHWYNLAGFPIVSRWENDNVFNTDFTDGPGKDMDPPVSLVRQRAGFDLRLGQIDSTDSNYRKLIS